MGGAGGESGDGFAPAVLPALAGSDCKSVAGAGGSNNPAIVRILTREGAPAGSCTRGHPRALAPPPAPRVPKRTTSHTRCIMHVTRPRHPQRHRQLQRAGGDRRGRLWARLQGHAFHHAGGDQGARPRALRCRPARRSRPARRCRPACRCRPARCCQPLRRGRPARRLQPNACTLTVQLPLSPPPTTR